MIDASATFRRRVLTLTLIIILCQECTASPLQSSEEGASGRVYNHMPSIPIGVRANDNSLRFGIVDSGVDASHPQIEGFLLDQKDFTGEGLEDRHHHGTRVALATLYSMYRRAPSIRPPALLSAKVVGEEAVAVSVTVQRIVAAIKWLAEKKVWVIEMSIAMPRESEELASFATLCAAIAEQAGIYFSVAAGNYGKDSEVYPAACRSRHATRNITVVGERVPGGGPAKHSGPADYYSPPPPLPPLFRNQ